MREEAARVTMTRIKEGLDLSAWTESNCKITQLPPSQSCQARKRLGIAPGQATSLCSKGEKIEEDGGSSEFRFRVASQIHVRYQYFITMQFMSTAVRALYRIEPRTETSIQDCVHLDSVHPPNSTTYATANFENWSMWSKLNSGETSMRL